MPSEKFPVCVLFISLNPGRVDVNVHPAKLEVKFSNEKPVFEAIYYAVRQALEQNTARPEIEMTKGASAGVRMSDAFIPVERERSLKSRQISIETQGVVKPNATINGYSKSSVTVQDSIKPSATQAITHEVAAIKKSDKPTFMKITAEQYVREIMQYNDTPPRVEQTSTSSPKPADDNVKRVVGTHDAPTPQPKIDVDATASVTVEEKPSQAPEPVKIEYRIVGEVFNSYILVQLSEKMLIIDKHAAHERIIFEQLKKNMYSQKVSSQLLMLPIDIMLMSDEVSVIEEYRGELEAVGFEFSCSRNTVSVTAIPVGIEQEAVGDMFAVVADRIKNGTGKVELTRNIIFEKALYQASCKAAIKAGREYAKGHGEWLVEKLMELPDITFCPHGRPVAMEMSKKNIDRQFERT